MIRSSPRASFLLLLTFVLSLAGYILLRSWFPLAFHYDGAPLHDIRSLTPSPIEGLAYALWLLALFGLYGLAYGQIRRMDRPPAPALVLFAAALFCLPLIDTIPFNATDVYRYVIRGRVSSVYGQSPFITPPSGFAADPLLPLAGEWAGETSPYGPLWELAAAAVTALSRDNLYLGLVLFKGLGGAAHLAAAALIWLMLRAAPAADRVAYTLLWAWNPALLLTFVANGHNDGLMLFWLLLGAWLARRGQAATGFLVMALAALTKPIGLLPLPLFFLASWRQLPSLQARWRFLWLSGGGSLAVAALAFLPFGSPLHLAWRLLREASGGGSFSPSVLVILIGRHLSFNVSLAAVAGVAQLLFLLLILWLLWRTWYGRSPERGTADTFAGYLLQALNFRIWYATWPFPWLLLDDATQDNRFGFRLQAGLWLLLTSQLSVLIYGHLRVYALGGDHLPAHLIGVPFVFGLPLVLAYWRNRRG